MRAIPWFAGPVGCLLLAACSAVAQDRQEGGPGVAVPQDRSASGSSQPPSDDRTLTEKLSDSGGVVVPPKDVDPKMKQDAPSTGPQSMPVIPPPGTTPGSPIQPK
jgi:hypothetical protein